MSELGHSRQFVDVRVTSALPLIADLRQKDRHVRNVPLAVVAALTRPPPPAVASKAFPSACLCGADHRESATEGRERC